MTSDSQNLFNDMDASPAVGETASKRSTLESLKAIESCLNRFLFHFANERALQEGIAIALADDGWGFEREVRLSEKDRIDFLVEGIGIEVKVSGSMASVTRQLHRYAQFDRIDALVLVTSRMRHEQGLPEEMNGKPLRVLMIVSL